MNIIGCNKATDIIIGGKIDSSFSSKFDNEFVQLATGFDIVNVQIGNVTDAYKILLDKIKESNPKNEKEICNIIFATVWDYFGDYSQISQRMDYYADESEYQQGEGNYVSNLKGKNAAMCVERAMLSQNLLNLMGIKSFYKTSGIINNGIKEIHAYNLACVDGEYYIFDSTMPCLRNNQVDPLICQIPKEVFDKISSKDRYIGYAVAVEYYNPLREQFKNIIYDSGHMQNVYYAVNKNKTK